MPTAVSQDKPCDIHAWLSALGMPSADRDYQPGHERVHKLLFALQQAGLVFHRPKFRIRVAGTNGKGSTSHFLAAALEANGFKVGLYTSPHIRCFHERIRVQGTMIEEEDLVSFMRLLMPLALKVKASYFEAATVLALAHFSMQNVDIEILEAGVGARLDATTAVPADMGILTPVALDHQAWLGDDLASIAIEKSGVFTGCKQMLSAIQQPSVMKVISKVGLSVQYAVPLSRPLVMTGEHQRCNASLALQAVQSIYDKGGAIGARIDMQRAEDAIAQTQVAGRLQHVVYQKHHFWLDAAHNEHAVAHIVEALTVLEPFDVIFLCTREDRDLSACLPMLQPFARKVVRLTGSLTHDYSDVTSALTAEVTALDAGHFLLLGSFVTLDLALTWMER